MQVAIDVKLKLMAGLPIPIEDFKEIKPLTLGEIVNHGYTDYLEKLNFITLTKEQLMESMKQNLIDQLPSEVNEFDLLFTLADETIKKMFKESLEFFIKEKLTAFDKKQLMAFEDSHGNIRVLNRNNYQAIANVILLQNFVKSADENSNVVLKDEKAKKVAERMKKAKEEVKRIKAKEQGDIESDFFDLVSAISSKSYSINKFNIFDLTMFQLYEEYKRLSFIDQYEVNVNAMLQGAKNITLKHWSNKII